MIKKKYQVLIFKDNAGKCSTYTVRLWVCLLLVGVFVGSLGLNLYFFQNFQESSVLQARLQSAQKSLLDQQDQFLALTEKLKAAQSQLNKVADFNAKIRVMANLDPGYTPTATSIGGTERSDFTEQYLTSHRQELLVRKMHDFLDQLQTETRLEELQQEELLAVLRSNQNFFASTPSIWPTEGFVTSGFGYRSSPFTGRREFHQGVDIAGPPGTPVYATANGQVIFAGKDGAFGLSVNINHGASIVTSYSHLHSIAVKVGQSVSRGELVGYMGSTGRATGPHLHYEVRLNGIPVDPMRYILN
jgi:murein DD-endopeptidase MepM/ murein hydrolase activator NlpD